MPIYTGVVEQSNLVNVIFQNAQSSGYFRHLPDTFGRFRYMVVELEQKYSYVDNYSHYYYHQLGVTEVSVINTKGVNIATAPFAVHSTVGTPSNWDANKGKLVDGNTSTVAVYFGRDGSYSGYSSTEYSRFAIDFGQPHDIRSISIGLTGGYANKHTVRIYLTNYYLPEHVSESRSNSSLILVGWLLLPSASLQLYTFSGRSLYDVQESHPWASSYAADGITCSPTVYPVFSNYGSFYGSARHIGYLQKVEKDYMIVVTNGYPYVSSGVLTNVYYIGRGLMSDGRMSNDLMSASTVGRETGRAYLGNKALSLAFAGMTAAQTDIPWITLYQPLYGPIGNGQYVAPKDIYLARVRRDLLLDREVITSRTGERYLFVRNMVLSGISYSISGGGTTSYYNNFLPGTNPGDVFLVVKL